MDAKMLRLASATAWLALAATPQTAPAVPTADNGRALMQDLVRVLDTGDEAAYDRFVRQNYSPAALKEYPPEDHVAWLARIYTDTGGFAIERMAGEGVTWVQAEARDRITGVRYCLTLDKAKVGDREFISDFNTRGIYPAGPHLRTPNVREVTRTVRSLAREYERRGLFSGVILIAKDDKIIFQEAYGHASLAYNVPMTLDTRLNVASIGKSLTGVAIGQLVDAGKLSYDDTVGKWLPDYPDKDVREKATIRELLAHTSGLGPIDYWQKPEWAAARPRLRSVADYMKLVVGTPIGAEEGKFLYSNSGYVLLGAIIEKVTGQSFYDYVEARIFKPAGMTRSFYHEMDQEDPKVAAPLTNLFTNSDGKEIYRLGRPRNAVYDLGVKGGPQGGAYVTAADLLRFEKALYEGKLVSQERLKEMMTPHSPSGAGAAGLTGEVREGLGIEVITQNGHRLFGHTGGDLGIASFVYRYPELGYTTIALTNRDPRATRILTNVSRSLLTRQSVNGAVPPPQRCEPPKRS
jgi:CubicO group peptidase (beta-lactamase class C family)